jgi:hypothetical protein
LAKTLIVTRSSGDMHYWNGRHDRSPAARADGANGRCTSGAALAAAPGGTVEVLRVHREKVALSSECKYRLSTAPVESNRRTYGGNEMAEAFQ